MKCAQCPVTDGPCASESSGWLCGLAGQSETHDRHIVARSRIIEPDPVPDLVVVPLPAREPTPEHRQAEIRASLRLAKLVKKCPYASKSGAPCGCNWCAIAGAIRSAQECFDCVKTYPI